MKAGKEHSHYRRSSALGNRQFSRDVKGASAGFTEPTFKSDKGVGWSSFKKKETKPSIPSATTITSESDVDVDRIKQTSHV